MVDERAYLDKQITSIIQYNKNLEELIRNFYRKLYNWETENNIPEFIKDEYILNFHTVIFPGSKLIK